MNRAVAPLKHAPGCDLAGYDAFGYRRRSPGRHRHRRGRPSGPKAGLTALRRWRNSPLRRLFRRPWTTQSSFRSNGSSRRPAALRRCQRSCGTFGPCVRNAHSFNTAHRNQESSWPRPLPPTRRVKILPRCLKNPSPPGNLHEGSVIKGIVVGIEKDVAIIDVGLKTEGRVQLREFTGPGRGNEIKIGDEVEVYLERVENALGEAVLSRDKARREESWGKLEERVQEPGKGSGRHLQSGQGRLHRRSRRRGGLPAALAGRHPPDPRRHPADEQRRSRSRS